MMHCRGNKPVRLTEISVEEEKEEVQDRRQRFHHV